MAGKTTFAPNQSVKIEKRYKNLAIMAGQLKRPANVRLPPDVNRILYIKNLPYKITAEEMYDIFGKYGALRQIRVGVTPETRGSAFVIYEDIFDAKNACDHLSGFNVCNRYLVVLYYQATRAWQRLDTDKQRDQLEKVKEKFGIGLGSATIDREQLTPLRTPGRTPAAGGSGAAGRTPARK